MTDLYKLIQTKPNPGLPMLVKESARTDITLFLEVPSFLKAMHWTTTSYAKHVALDTGKKDLEDALDSFMECYIANTDRDFKAASYRPDFKMVDDIEKETKRYRKEIAELCKELSGKNGTLISLAENIDSIFDQLIYRLQLS